MAKRKPPRTDVTATFNYEGTLFRYLNSYKREPPQMWFNVTHTAHLDPQPESTQCSDLENEMVMALWRAGKGHTSGKG